jgi:hypothetical protein
VIQKTYSATCQYEPEMECPGGSSHGTGLAAFLDGSLSVVNVLVDESEVAGVQMAEGGTFAADALTVRKNPIGVNIQDVPEEYLFFEQVTGLRMEDNVINFDSVELPVPNPLSVLDE